MLEIFGRLIGMVFVCAVGALMALGLYSMGKELIQKPAATLKSLLGVLVFFVSALVLAGLVFSVSDLSDAQREHQKKFTGLTSKEQYLKAQCGLKKGCSEYREILKECSAAGDVDRCVEINTNNPLIKYL